MKVIGPVVALLEANQPGCLTMPIAQAFTFHLEGVAHARMKDQRQNSKTATRDLLWETGKRQVRRAIFVDQKKTRVGFRNGRHIIEFARFCPGGMAQTVKSLVQQVLYCGESGNIVYELFYAFTRAVHHLFVGTVDPAGHRQLGVIDAERLPALHGERRFAESKQRVHALPGSRRLLLVFRVTRPRRVSLFNLVDQVTNLPRHWTSRGILEVRLERKQALLIALQIQQRLS